MPSLKRKPLLFKTIHMHVGSLKKWQIPSVLFVLLSVTNSFYCKYEWCDNLFICILTGDYHLLEAFKRLQTLSPYAVHRLCGYAVTLATLAIKHISASYIPAEYILLFLPLLVLLLLFFLINVLFRLNLK